MYFCNNTVSRVLNPVGGKNKNMNSTSCKLYCTTEREVTGVERDRQLSLPHAAVWFDHLTTSHTPIYQTSQFPTFLSVLAKWINNPTHRLSLTNRITNTSTVSTYTHTHCLSLSRYMSYCFIDLKRPVLHWRCGGTWKGIIHFIWYNVDDKLIGADYEGRHSVQFLWTVLEWGES